MIIENSSSKIKYKVTGGINNNNKLAKPITKVKCDKCSKIFTEKTYIFEKRLELINLEYCGKCARPLMASIAGINANYDSDGNLKNNSGRFTKEKWGNLTPKELNIRLKHNKKIAIDYHEKLKNNPKLKNEHYSKVYKKSKIGYISRAQKKIYEYLKDYGYEIDGLVSGMRVDIVNLDKKIAIEYNGDYWHCNPRTWSSDDYNKSIKMTAKEKWDSDRKRRFMLRKLGFDVYVIWENTWVNDRTVVYDKLNKIINGEIDFPKWKPKMSEPLKGRTFEDIYGIEKAKLMKKSMSLRHTGKIVNKKIYYEIKTPNDGVFYVERLTDWHKNVYGSHSKFINITKKNKIDVTDVNFWIPKKMKLILNKNKNEIKGN
jgi:G:T-mismatch repair DNA endonuclease (very short patch repair protein)